MKRAMVTTLLVLLCLASAAGGYWLGFRDAWYLGIAAESMPRGVVATHQLRYLRAGTPGPVIVALEFDVDKGLTRAEDVLGHPLHGLFGPLWDLPIHPRYERFATELANHRRRNPSLLDPATFGNNPGLVLDAQDTKAKIDRMVERYATAK